MSTTLESVEFHIYTDDASIRRAAERIKSGPGLAGFSLPIWNTRASLERRSEPRQLFVDGAFLMPVESDGGRARQLDPDEPLLPVITLDISPRGVGVQHERPLPSETYVLTFDLWSHTPVTLLVERCWSRADDDSAFGHRSGFAILGVAKERRPDRC